MKMINKTRFFLLIPILIWGNACQSSEPQNYERIERFETGVVSRRVQIVNGKKEGKMTDYYPDGKLMAERWFKDGVQDGRTVIYYPGGNIKEVQHYRQGQQHGGDTLWYENGRIQFAVTFEQNKKNGYLSKWSPTGALVFESRYVMDTLVEVKGKRLLQDSIQAYYSGDTLIRQSRQ